MTSLFDVMRAHECEDAIAASGTVMTYDNMLANVKAWKERLDASGLPRGAVVGTDSQYNGETMSLLLALMQHGAIMVPLSGEAKSRAQEFEEIAQLEWYIRLAHQSFTIEPTGRRAQHPLYEALHERDTPGLVLFSSGSTGKSKASVHDLNLLLKKFRQPRRRWRTLLFLGLDHIGGINTLFFTLFNGGMAVAPVDRSPTAVCQAIQLYSVELLPTSPSFLNFLILSDAYKTYDLSSLELITYGTEPMPQSTLDRLVQVFPRVRFQQTYGLTELGILRSKSRDSRSLWVRIGGEGYQTKVVHNRLWIKAESAMLGYLNALSPLDAQGYFDTGDMVEVAGEWLRILGRASDLINVGGSKVFPAEVESVLLGLENVNDVIVYGEANPFTGQTVAATFRLKHEEPAAQFKTRMRRFCLNQLAPYKVPTRIRLTNEPLYNERFKRMRR